MRIALEPAFVDHRRYHLDRPPPVIVGDGIDALAIEQLVAFRLVAGEAEREHAADRAIEVHVDRFEQVVRVRGNLRRPATGGIQRRRSEEHTSELQSLMRISYAVFCLKKTKT